MVCPYNSKYLRWPIYKEKSNYLGSEFCRFQSMTVWLVILGLCGTHYGWLSWVYVRHIMAEACDRAKVYFTSGQQRGKKEGAGVLLSYWACLPWAKDIPAVPIQQTRGPLSHLFVIFSSSFNHLKCVFFPYFMFLCFVLFEFVWDFVYLFVLRQCLTI